MSKYNWKNIKGVGLGIVAFEATEHLINIISEVRETFDYVAIGLQRLSYHGDPIDPTDLAEIMRLRDEDHIVDNILEIKLDTTKAPRVQETDKRNLLVQDIEDHGCSHALIIDSDEFYSNSTVLKALVEIDKNDYEITYCQYANYYHDYMHYLVYPFQEGMYVPFITKTKYRFNFECKDFTLPSDPTRRYVRPFDGYKPVVNEKGEQVKNEKGEIVQVKNYTVEYHVFDWKTVRMHHFSCIRADIRKKFNNWSSKTCFQNYNDLIDKAVDTYNHFDPESKEQQTASLLFGTPGHKVYVRAFDKQYIHPKFDIMERYKVVKDYKKIAIMNLSSTNSEVDLFNELEKTCKSTWAKDVVNGKYKNIDYWTVIDTDQNSHIDTLKHTIYIKTDYTQDNTQQLLMRWLLAFELLETNNYKYDWVLRTNTSTWCNIDLINEFLAYETDDSMSYAFKLFAAFWSMFNLYLSGAGMLWSTRNVRILRKLVDKTDQQTLDLALDDVMMSALWRKRAIEIGIDDPNCMYHSLEGKHLVDLDQNTKYNEIDFNIPMFQIKTYQNTDGTYIDGSKHSNRLIHDIVKMKKLQEMWEETKKSANIDEMAVNLRKNMDKTINVIKYSKKDWLDENAIPADIKSIQAFANIMPYNKETMDFLCQRAIDCGYVKK